MRLGIFGGTFNPVHDGHLRTAEEARYKLRLDKVIFVPSGTPPLKETDTVASSHRFAMVKLAVASNKDFIVSDLEAGKQGKTYTVDTLRKLRKEFPGDVMYFILGVDAFLELPKWRQPEELTGLADFAIVSRPGFRLDDVVNSPYIKGADTEEVNREVSGKKMIRTLADSRPAVHQLRSYRLASGRRAFLVPVTRLDISSTDIRHLIEQKRSIKYLLPLSVERYIKKHKLYLKT
ncbi:MAG: nicotinate-nucleotide adenylyltransferase [Nitrospirae bacterium]|nr:nicotinate-nucleotide adenylyltransferase [Nitrospirota bacterium]